MTDLQCQLNQLAKATHVFVMQSGISPLLRHTRPASHWNNSHNILSTVDCSGADSDHHLARLYKPHALICMTERSSQDLSHKWKQESTANIVHFTQKPYITHLTHLTHVTHLTHIKYLTHISYPGEVVCMMLKTVLC